MNSIKVKISEVKSNPNNPRIIKDDKFQKLVKSIKEFPEMLSIRPIVVNSDMVVLGGNMRLKACKEAGLKEIVIIKADDLTEEQQNQFIIKDNVSFGEWDWDELANKWDEKSLKEWGIDLNINFDFQPNLNPTSEYNPITSADMLRASNGLNDVIDDVRKEQEVICPHCASIFKITI
jgi:hypothetical protein